MNRLRLVLPLLLSKKNNAIVRKRYRKHDTPKGKAGSVYLGVGKHWDVLRQEQAIRKAVLVALHHVAPMIPEQHDVTVQVTWHVPDAKLVVIVEAIPRVHEVRSHDLGNMADTLLDALQHAAYANDAQVAGLVLRKVAHRIGESEPTTITNGAPGHLQAMGLRRVDQHDLLPMAQNSLDPTLRAMAAELLDLRPKVHA